MRGYLLACVLVAATAAAMSCLPGDTRPPPARVDVTAEASSATRDGFVTSDGWAVTFDRVAMGIGNVDLDGEDCTDYGRANYQWLIDFEVAGVEKVGTIYGLGSCTLKFQVRMPSSTRTVFGAGATDPLFARMRELDSDFWEVQSRTAVLVTGRASRDGTTKTFDWSFRRGHEYYRCAQEDGGGNLDVLRLDESSRRTRQIAIVAEELFRLFPSDDAPLVFDPVTKRTGPWIDARALGRACRGTRAPSTPIALAVVLFAVWALYARVVV